MRRHKALKRQLWWIDILMSLLLACAVLAGFIALIYSGQKHRRIASMIEERFIGSSLGFAGSAKVSETNWAIILSLKNIDERLFKLTSVKGNTDISIRDYGDLLTRIFRGLPRAVYFAWTPSAHDKNESYEPLIQALQQSGSVKVFMGVRYNQIAQIPESIKKLVGIIDSDSCMGATQIICTYNPSWQDWMPQVLASEFFSDYGRRDDIPFISNNLPRSDPSYLVYLQDTGSFNHMDFSTFMQGSAAEDLRDKIVFIGSSIDRSPEGITNSEMEDDRVITHLSAQVSESQREGFPLHVYWAQLAQMFRSGPRILVASEIISWSLTVIFVAGILAVLKTLGVGASLGFFLLFALAAPYLNGWLIRLFAFYVPVFNIIFAGISAYLFASFGSIALHGYRRWAIQMAKRQEVELIDLKGNFLSLISHNLNTPVAKMQGMIDILQSAGGSPQDNLLAQKAGYAVAHIQMCIRAVLTANALLGDSIQNVPVTVGVIREDFVAQMRSSLARLNCYPEIVGNGLDEELMALPLSFDAKAISSVIAGACSLFKSEHKQYLQLEIGVRDRDECGQQVEGLVIRVIGPTTGGSPMICALLNNQDGHLLASAELLIDVCIRLLHAATKSYRGHVRGEWDSTRTVVALTLFPVSPGGSGT